MRNHHFFRSTEVPFLQDDVVGNFSDVTILSSNNEAFLVNKLLMASCSSLLRKILDSQIDDGPITFSSELNGNQLEQVISFINHGMVWSYEKGKPSPSLLQDLAMFGIDVNRLEWESIKADNSLIKSEPTVKVEVEEDDEDDRFEDLEDLFSLNEEEPLKKKRRSWKRRRKPMMDEKVEDQPKKRRRKTSGSASLKRGRPKKPRDPNEGERVQYYLARNYFHFPQPGETDLSRPFSCTKCVRKFEEEEDLLQHLRRHEKMDPMESFFCFVCKNPKAVFKSEKDYADHRVIKCPGDYPLRLQGRGTFLTKDITHKWSERMNSKELIFHFPLKDADDISYPFKCTLCIRAFLREQSLKQHLHRHLHSGERDKVFYCLSCYDVSFEDWENYRRHSKDCQALMKDKEPVTLPPSVEELYEKHGLIKNKEETPVECASCGVMCPTRLSLKKHRKNMGPFHTDNCATCGFAVQSWQEHVTHAEKEHNGVLLRRCGLCEEVFSSEKEKMSHKKEAHKYITGFQPNYKSVFCDICGKEFSRHYYRTHRELAHGTANLTCSQCPHLEFNSERKYMAHIKIHNKNIFCEICGYATHDQRALNRHHKTKHLAIDQKPHKCHVCGKGYVTAAVLKDHMNIHTNERPYKCEFCPADFNSSGNFAAHVKRVHKGIKRSK